jgi:hypothetical protein
MLVTLCINIRINRRDPEAGSSRPIAREFDFAVEYPTNAVLSNDRHFPLPTCCAVF